MNFLCIKNCKNLRFYSQANKLTFHRFIHGCWQKIWDQRQRTLILGPRQRTLLFTAITVTRVSSFALDSLNLNFQSQHWEGQVHTSELHYRRKTLCLWPQMFYNGQLACLPLIPKGIFIYHGCKQTCALFQKETYLHLSRPLSIKAFLKR